MKKVIFIDTVHANLEEGLTALNFECIDASNWSLERIKDVLPGIYGIVIRSRFRMDEDILKNAEQLKFIARSGAGMENIDEAFCNQRNILLLNAPEGNRQAVAEHALGMLLALFNKLLKGNAEVKSGKWNREGNRGIELSERTVGIIGYGNNGSAFAKVLSGFGCRILAYDKYKSNFQSGSVEEVSLDQIKKECDVLSFHIPQNSETIKLFDQHFLSEMQHEFFLLNLSRGKIVDAEAVMIGLEINKILGAGLDVLEYEKTSFEDFFSEKELPKPLQYFMESDKVILSPHVGGWTVESYRKLSDVLLTKIQIALNSKEI